MYKNIFTSALTLMLALAAAPQSIEAQGLSLTPKSDKSTTLVKRSSAKNTKTTLTTKLADGKYLATYSDGIFKRKRIESVTDINNTVTIGSKALLKAQKQRKASSGSAALWESFEDYDPESATDWLPDGWSRQRTSDETDIDEAWLVGEAENFAAPDGYCYAGINYSSEYKDEWLVTPEVTVAENQVLAFYTYFNPIYMFDMSDENVDWDNLEFINKVQAMSLQVMAQVDGGEWTVIKDFYADYKDMSFLDIYYSQMSDFTKVSLPLTEYVGKSVKFAFRYSGTDADTWFIDAVSVDLPKLEAKFQLPLNEQYFGFKCNADFENLEQGLAIFPAYSDIVWTNVSNDETATYYWNYEKPRSDKGTKVEETEESLTLRYSPYYYLDDESREYFCMTPALVATALGAATGSYDEKVYMFKVGGKAEFRELDSTTYDEYGILPFDPGTEAITFLTAESPDGETADVPVFGYSDQTKNYWTNRTFHGEDEDGDYSQVMGYMNYIVPGDKPLVVEKVWANALGKISDDAVFKASFYALNASNEVPDEPFVTATCKGSDVMKTEGYSRDYLTIPFTFNAPVVLEQTDDTPGYLVEISGFTDGGVTYYAPVQSYYPNQDSKNLGWLNLNINWQGEERRSISPISNFENENGQMYCSFAINLGGYYPWLYTDIETVEIGDGETQTVALDSYYEASKLSVTCADGSALPSWLKAEMSGQYDKAVLTLTSTSTAAEDKADIVVTAPGVKVALTVNKVIGAAINSATSNAPATVKSVYSISGQRIANASTSNGLYIQIDSNGHAHKVVR